MLWEAQYPRAQNTPPPRSMHEYPFLPNSLAENLIQMLHLRLWKILSAQAPPPIWLTQ